MEECRETDRQTPTNTHTHIELVFSYDICTAICGTEYYEKIKLKVVLRRLLTGWSNEILDALKNDSLYSVLNDIPNNTCVQPQI